jgi:hypothetical protein
MIEKIQKMKSWILKRFDENPSLLKIISREDFQKYLNDMDINGNLEHTITQGIVRYLDLPSWLLMLEEKSPDIFEKVIKKIKRCNQSENFNSLMSELRILVFYLQRFTGKNELEYEPQSVGSKKTDFLIHLNGKEIHVEVTALMTDALQRGINSNYEHFSKTVAGISDNPFSVRFDELPYKSSTKETEEFDEFIIKEIEKARVSQEEPLPLTFRGCDGHVFGLHLKKSGLAGSAGYSTEELIQSSDDKMNPVERIKIKLIGELEQVPKDKPVILIIDLTSSLMAQLVYFGQAVIGQKDYGIKGFFDQQEAKNITGVLGFRDYLENCCFVHNPYSEFQLTKDELKLLIPENVFQATEMNNNPC